MLLKRTKPLLYILVNFGRKLILANSLLLFETGSLKIPNKYVVAINLFRYICEFLRNSPA